MRQSWSVASTCKVLVFLFALVGASASSALAAPSSAGRRVALVVGNSAYQHVAQVRNPRNDAEDVGAALRQLGFAVTVTLDADKNTFRKALQDFGRSVEAADVALFFYSGQALEVEGRNWLGPVDMKVTGLDDLAQEMQSFEDVIATLERGRGLKIAIIDACRDNPLGGTRGVSRGLARVDSPGIQWAIMMSTSPGSVALDGTGRNSPFTSALLAHITTPDLEFSSMMQRVVRDVVRDTAGQQQPWFSVSLLGDFYFRRSEGIVVESPALVATAQADRIADEVWKFIRSTKDPEQLKSFLITYPKSSYVGEASERMTALFAAQEKLKAAVAGGPQKRVALVIGNGAYQHTRALKNPVNDAEAVTQALKRLGFEVRTELNVDKHGFDSVMPEFSLVAAGADIALVYFSGHAIEFQGAAYVMPVDAQPISRSHIRNQLKSVRDIVFDLENASGLKIVVVDGCRDNPLAARLFGMLGIPRTAAGDSRGFSIPDVDQQQLGELIVAFATLHGEAAYDGGAEPNSPFTAAFLKHVGDEGVDVDQLFRIVKDEVIDATRGLQNPAIESYRGKRVFALRPAPPEPTAAAK